MNGLAYVQFFWSENEIQQAQGLVGTLTASLGLMWFINLLPSSVWAGWNSQEWFQASGPNTAFWLVELAMHPGNGTGNGGKLHPFKDCGSTNAPLAFLGLDFIENFRQFSHCHVDPNFSLKILPWKHCAYQRHSASRSPCCGNMPLWGILLRPVAYSHSWALYVF